MHAALTVNGNLLMGSDDPTTESVGPVQGMQVNYSTPDAGEAKRFDILADERAAVGPVGPDPARP